MTTARPSRKKRVNRHIAKAIANTCVRCGYSLENHEIANYSDGHIISRTVLICPGATGKFPNKVTHD